MNLLWGVKNTLMSALLDVTRFVAIFVAGDSVLAPFNPLTTHKKRKSRIGIKAFLLDTAALPDLHPGGAIYLL